VSNYQLFKEYPAPWLYIENWPTSSSADKWLWVICCSSPTPSPEVKNAWSCTSTPPIRLRGVVHS